MFLVVNTTQKPVSIGDLGLNIEPKQMFDLDSLNLKMEPDKSTDLKSAIKMGMIKIMKKDDSSSAGPSEGGNSGGVNTDSTEDLKKFMKEEMAKLLKEIGGPPKQEVQSEDKTTAMLAEIKKMLTAKQALDINSSQGNINQSNNNNSSDNDGSDEDFELNEDLMSEIHAKAVNRMSEESNIKSNLSDYNEGEEESVEADSLLDDIADLENLQ